MAKLLAAVFVLLLSSPSFAALEIMVGWTPDSSVAGFDISYTVNGETQRIVLTDETRSDVLIPLTVAGTYEIVKRCFCANDQYCSERQIGSITVIDNGEIVSATPLTIVQTKDNSEAVEPCLDNCIIDPVTN